MTTTRTLGLQEAIDYAIERFHKDDFDGAESICLQILKQQPRCLPPMFLMAQIDGSGTRHQFGRAIDWCKKILQIDTANVTAMSLLGIFLWRNGEYSAAVDHIQRMLDGVLPKPNDPVSHYEYRALSTLTKYGAPDIDAQLAELQSYLVDTLAVSHRELFLAVLEFNALAPREWAARIYQHLVAPAIRRIALDQEDINNASRLQRLSLSAIGVRPNTGEQWKWCFDQTTPSFIEAGERVGNALAPQTLPSTEGAIKFAFVIDFSAHVGSGLDHLLNVLRTFADAPDARVVPCVYSLLKAPEKLRSHCEAWGFELVDFATERGRSLDEDDFREAALAVRQRASDDGLHAAIFITTFDWQVAYLASVGIAPVQVFFTMGFQSLSVPKFDAYFTPSSAVTGWKQIYGRRWRSFAMPFDLVLRRMDDAVLSAARQAAQTIREQELSGFTVTLGTLARPEKFTWEFIDTVGRILEENSEAVFLWFGLHPIKEVIAWIAQRGIADRCRFMGWHETKAYVFLVDIHLDSIGGMPTGLTMWESMSAGNGYVLHMGQDSLTLGVTSVLYSLFDPTTEESEDVLAYRQVFEDQEAGVSYAMLARTLDEYVEMAGKQIRDAEFRRRVGLAAQRFVEHYCGDASNFSHAFAEQLVEVVTQKAKAAADRAGDQHA